MVNKLENNLDRIIFDKSKDLAVPTKNILKILLRMEEIEIEATKKRRLKNGKF